MQINKKEAIKAVFCFMRRLGLRVKK